MHCKLGLADVTEIAGISFWLMHSDSSLIVITVLAAFCMMPACLYIMYMAAGVCFYPKLQSSMPEHQSCKIWLPCIDQTARMGLEDAFTH